MNDLVPLLFIVVLIGVGVFLIAKSKKQTKEFAPKSPKQPNLGDFIRNLLLERASIEFGDYSRDLFQTVIQVRKMPEIELMGTPEATVATIVKTYDLGKQSGVCEQEILSNIEAHRGDSTSRFNPEMSLREYIVYRVALEHESHGQDFSSYFDPWIAISRRFFQCEARGDLSEERLSEICHALSDRVGRRQSPEPSHDALALLKAERMALSAIKAASELYIAGNVEEAEAVITHFRLHEAFP